MFIVRINTIMLRSKVSNYSINCFITTHMHNNNTKSWEKAINKVIPENIRNKKKENIISCILTSHFEAHAGDDKSYNYRNQYILIGCKSDRDIKLWFERVGARYHRPTWISKPKTKQSCTFLHLFFCCWPLCKLSMQPVRMQPQCAETVR